MRHTGLATWTPSATSPEQAEVVLQVYDSAGAHDTQAFLLQVAGVNRQPVLATLPAEIQGTEGKLLEILVQALDPDDDPLVYWSDHLPPGAVFDAARKMLVWTPTYQDAGTYENVTLAVSDGLHTVLGITTLVIAPSAPALTFLQPPDVVVREGDPVTVQLQASDAQGLPLTFTGNLLPPGSSLDPRTGLFTWTPDYTQNGLHVAPVTVSNGEIEATQILGIVVLNVNAPPVFTNLDTYEGIEGQEVQIRGDARDPDNLLFTPPDRAADGSLVQEDPGVSTLVVAASNLPTGATFDPVTQMLQWTPGYADAGLHSVTFTATDDGDNTGTPQTTTKTVVLHIGNVNRAPLVPVIENQTVQRGTTLELPIQTTDLDGDPLVLTVSGLPRFGSFVDHGDGTGLLRFTPDYGDRGNFAITLRATDDGDGGGVTKVLFDQRSFVLAAQSANEPPHLDWIGDKVAVVDSPLQFTLRVGDLDQGPLSFTADGLPLGATITPSPIYGRATVQWTPTVTDIGTHTVTFHVNDDGNGNANLALADHRTIDLVVRATNAGPSLSAIDNQVIAEGQTLVMTPSGTDPDGDALTWSVANLPPGATVDPVQGILRWTPEVFQRGNYPGITITASDGNQSSSQTFAVGVAKTNQPPVLFPMAEQIGREDVQLKFSLAANDVDGDVVTFVALSALPLGAQLNSQSGQFQWTPTFNQAGIYTLRVEARDSEGLGSTRDIPLRILNVNRPPTLQVSDRSALLGESFHFALAAQDPDAGTLFTYAASGLPLGANLNPQTGVFDWTPEVGQISTYVVSFSVSDGEATAQDSAELRALVARPPLNLTIELTPSFPVLPGQGVLIHLAAGSFSALTGLTLKVDGQPVTLDAQGRGQFTPAAPGQILVEASATNVDSQVGQASTILKVRDPADQTAPVVTLDGTLSGVRLTTITDILGSINDSNLDSWILEAALAGSDRFITLAQGHVAVTGTLARFDPSTVLNGVYRLRLTAIDIGGRSAQTEVVVEVNTSAKPTQYLSQATDLIVQLSGSTLNLVRAYDSFSRETVGSFGNGWRLANRDTDIQTSVPPTGHEQTGIFNPFRQGTRVYLNLPDGRRVGFTFTPEKHELLGVTYYTPAFQADPGVDWRLDSAQTKLTRGPDGFYDLQTARPYHPANSWFVGPEYTLTGPDGTVYLLSTARGVEQQLLPNGARLVFTDNGIISSTGERVQFVRDAAGRVTTLEGPDGSRLVYSYDNRGNLTTVRNAGTGQSSRFGYATDDPHLLTLFTTPDPQGGYTIQYGATLRTFPVGIDLGSADQFLTNVVHGSLAAGATGRLAFSLRPSEMRSIPTGTVLMGVEVQADTGSALEPAVPVLPGFTPLLQRASGGSAFALFAVNRDGLNLLEVRGKTPGTFGGFVLRVFVAGDANADGAVDGVDGNTVAAVIGSTAGQAGYSTAADGNLDGVIDATDVQLVGSNLGFMANRPPLAQPGEVLTHVDLPLPVDLTGQAHDREGDSVFFRVVGAEHGTATLNPDGLTVTFIPEAGYSGQSGFQFLADDGYGQSPVTTITVDVSAAPLVNLDFQTRNFRLSQGRAGQAVMIGDFADQQDVVLDPSYVTFLSTVPSVATVSSQGHVQALADGTGILLVTSHGLQAASAITVGIPQDALGKQLYDVGLDPFPLAVSLSSHGGTRQFVVQSNGDIDLATNLGPAVSGTHYFVSRPGVVTVTPDGLMRAQTAGTLWVTIINGPAESVIPVLVEEPRTGQVTLGAAGGVVQGTDGSIVAVPPGVLAEGTTVSIVPQTAADLPEPMPDGFTFGGAFQLDVGAETLSVSLQLAIPVPANIPAGTNVYFFRSGQTLDESGNLMPIWWQVESGVVGTDGFAHTNSPPYTGAADSGFYMVGYSIDGALGQLRVQLSKEASGSLSVLVPGGTGSWIGSALGGSISNIIATIAVPFAPLPLLVQLQTIPRLGLPQRTAANVQIDAGKVTVLKASLPIAPVVSVVPAPRLSGAELTFPTVGGLVQPEVVLSGVDFFTPNPGHQPPTLSDLLVAFTEPNGREVYVAPKIGDAFGELRVEVPAGMALGLARIALLRKDQEYAPAPGANYFVPKYKMSVSNPIHLDPTGNYVFVALPEGDFHPGGIRGQVAVLDGNSNSPHFNELIARIGVGEAYRYAMPRAVALTPDNTRAYVTLRGGASIAVIDTLTLQQIDLSARGAAVQSNGPPSIPLPPGGGVALDPALRFGVLTKSTDVFGSVSIAGMTSWHLEYARLGSQVYTLLASGTAPVKSDLLGVFNPLSVADGTYKLRLTALSHAAVLRETEFLVEATANTPLKEIRLPTGTTPYGIVIDDAGQYAYVAEQPCAHFRRRLDPLADLCHRRQSQVDDLQPARQRDRAHDLGHAGGYPDAADRADWPAEPGDLPRRPAPVRDRPQLASRPEWRPHVRHLSRQPDRDRPQGPGQRQAARRYASESHSRRSRHLWCGRGSGSSRRSRLHELTEQRRGRFCGLGPRQAACFLRPGAAPGEQRRRHRLHS